MKYLFKSILLLVCFSSTVCYAQFIGLKPERNVPALVEEAFQNKFPGHDPVWYSKYQGRYNQKLLYEGRFMFDNRYSAAVYDTDGIMVAFAATVELSEVPKTAMQYMEKNFPQRRIMDALLVTDRNNGVTYELGVFIDGELIIKIFNDKGDFVRSTRA